MLAIAAPAGDLIIACNYDATGVEWVDLFDNPVLAWLVDEGGQSPAMPVTLGTLPPEASTAPIVSPQWAHGADGVFVPDLWRGNAHEFFTWIATNNGAKRLVRGNFINAGLQNSLRSWAAQYPTLFNPAPF